MKNRRNRNKKSGFTLIELVVVIAIIGILAAVITPRVRLSIIKARDARAIATLDTLRTASNVYFAEKGTAAGTVATTSTGSTAMGTDFIDKLATAGYLDTKSANTLKAYPIVNSAVAIEVGSTSPAANCPTGAGTPTPIVAGNVPVYIDADGVGLSFNSSNYDANCTIWNGK